MAAKAGYTVRDVQRIRIGRFRCKPAFPFFQHQEKGETMFDEILKQVVEKTPGGLAGVLLATDGIIVATYQVPDSTLELELMSAEIVAIFNQWRTASSSSSFGVAEEFVFKSPETTLICSFLTSEYLLALAVDAKQPFGKGRYLLRLAAETVRAEL